jgi:8-amino-3,8-dideoxy-alpha-D-manno-octulosonate transaminase
MSELTGAVMLAQLGRLDGLVEGMRKNKRRIKEQIKDLKGIKFRRLNDEEGDSAICLMYSLDPAIDINVYVNALQAEGVGAAGVFNKGIPDWHIYSHWKHIIEKATPTPEGCPYSCPYHKGEPVEYSENMCPNTNALISRMIHLDIPPQMTEADCDMIAEGIRKVTQAMA